MVCLVRTDTLSTNTGSMVICDMVIEECVNAIYRKRSTVVLDECPRINTVRAWIKGSTAIDCRDALRSPAKTPTFVLLHLAVANSFRAMGSFFSSSADATQTTEELPVVDLSDQNLVRQALDAEVIEVLQGLGYAPNRDDQKHKLLIMFIASVFASFGWAIGKVLPPTPYPGDRFWIAVCVVIYFTASSWLTYLATFADADLMWVSLPHEESKIILRFKSQMKRSEHYYTIALEFKDENGEKDKRPKASTELYIGSFFDKDGHIHKEGITDKVTQLHNAVGDKKNK